MEVKMDLKDCAIGFSAGEETGPRLFAAEKGRILIGHRRLFNPRSAESGVPFSA
jgi:hypothetical protein